MNVNESAPRENLLEVVFLQLLQARAATDDDRFDIQVIERVGHAVEKHTVFRDKLFGKLFLAVSFLRISATHVARRQDGLNTAFKKKRQCGDADLGEQAVIAASREIKDGFVIQGIGLTNNRHARRIGQTKSRP